VLGVDLVTAGEARAIVAGAIEEASAMIDGCIGVVASTPRGVRSEGAAVVVLEAEESARARGAAILARVGWCGRFAEARAALEAAPPPTGCAALVSSRDEAALAAAAAGTAWAEVPREIVAARAGEHESAGAFAAAAAVAAIAQGRLDHALVLADAGGRGVALSFTRASEP
jgi:3-oxoacyl-[acyl-carrier-protein] synthase II